jgi:hypothetical protein
MSHRTDAEALIAETDNGRTHERTTSQIIALAQVHATMYMADQQRLANLIAVSNSAWLDDSPEHLAMSRRARSGITRLLNGRDENPRYT